MKIPFYTVFLLLAVVSQSIFAFYRAEASELEPVVRLLESNEKAVVLECSVTDFQSEEQWIDNERFHLLSLPDAGYTSQIGWPQLPIKGVLVAVPPGTEAHLTILSSSDTIFSDYRVLPVPQPIIDPTADEPQFPHYEYRKDAVAYSSNRLYPDSPADTNFSGMLRGLSVVCVQFYPLRCNPVTGQLCFHRKIRIRISFVRKGSYGSGTVGPADGLESLYEDTVLNYESARKWYARPTGMGSQSFRQTGAVSPAVGSWKIYVREPGIYVLDDLDLTNAGLDLPALDPREIILTNHGEEIPIHVYGEEDGRFDPGDYIEFYGTIYEEDYGPYNVYRLSADASDGLRMAVEDGTPGNTAPVDESFLHTIHEEENGLRWSTFPGSETADRFFWKRIFAPEKADIYVDIDHLADTRENCTLRVMVRGNVKLDHHIRVHFNDILMEDARWYGQTQHFTEVQMPQTLLKEVANIVTIELPGDITPLDVIYLNWLEVDYYRQYITDDDRLEFTWQGDGSSCFQVAGFTQPELLVFDITNALYPIRIINPEIENMDSEYRLSFQSEGDTPRKYFALTAAQRRKPVRIVEDVPSNLRSAENGGDYIIITHEDFYRSILPLAQLREQEGLRVKVVQVEDIYDEFNYGLSSDKPIRDFLQYAYYNWIPPAPFCVLLVGDATYDHKDYYGLGDENYMPTHLSLTQYLGDSANDTWFVTVDGDDALPDMMIGRLPVKTVAQAEAVVEKIINYERYSTPGDWQRRVLIVADDETAFEKQSEQLAEIVPDGYEVTKIYLSAMTPASASAMVIDSINEGCLLLNYIGHGGWDVWAVERFFEVKDLPLLDQTNMLPFVINMTCLTGYFHHAQRDDILGERLLREPGKGAIATFTPAGASGSLWQSIFDQLIFGNLLVKKHRRLGTAIMEARISLVTNGVTGANPEIHNLLGDAALKLASPEPGIVWDVNGDGTVGFLDLVIVASHFGELITPLAYPNPDVNGDSVVDILDFIIVGKHFGEEYQGREQ